MSGYLLSPKLDLANSSLQSRFYIGLAVGCLALLFIDPSAPDASLIVVAVIGILMAVDGFAVAVDFQQDSLDKDADKEA